jgi:hypothetical protein
MKSMFIAALAATLFAAGPASSASITIDIDQPSSFGFIEQFYAGGTDSLGLAGPDLGVAFGPDAMALRNDETGPFFSGAPSPIGILTAVGSAATMNVAAGFVGEVSFWYSSAEAVQVNVWSGIDGTGSVLKTFQLANNATSGCSASPFCNWEKLSLNLGAGAVGRSITFGDAGAMTGFDNVTVTAVPEPESVVLLAFGLAGLGVAVARKKQQAFRV